MENTINPNNFEEVTLLDLYLVLKKRRYLILSVLAFGLLASGIASVLMPKIYESRAVILPVQQGNQGMGGINSVAAQFGLAAPISTNESEVVNLLKSNILREKVIRKYALLQVLFDPDDLEGMAEPEKMWLGLRRLEDDMEVKFNQKDNCVELSMRERNPEAAANILNFMLYELNEHMSSEARRVADTNRQYLESLINDVADPIILSKIYELVAKQVETSMMASVKENFAFKVIDPPSVPFEEVQPKVVLNIALGFILSLFFGVFVAFFMEYIHKIKNYKEDSGQ